MEGVELKSGYRDEVIRKMSKEELRDAIIMRCYKHRTLIAECGCFDELKSVGFLDTESTNLDSDFGIMICFSIYHHDKMHTYVINRKEWRDGNEERLIKRLWEELHYVKYIVVHNAGFDINYLRGKFIRYGISIPKHIRYIDTYEICKKKLRLSSCSLSAVASYLRTEHKKYWVDRECWRNLTQYKKKLIREIVIHNQLDVLVLREVWEKLRNVRYTLHYL